MRIFGLVVAAAVMVSAPAFADWKEYYLGDLGVRKDFPSDPTTTMGTYKSTLVPETPAHILTASYNGLNYTLTVVDLPERGAAGDGATLLGECDYNAMLAGKKVITDKSTDIGGGKNKIYGRWISTDLPDGTRMLTACYFTKGRLYRAEANVTKKSDDFPNTPDAFRFVNAIDFNMDPNRDAPRPPRPAAGAAPAGGAN